jgi:WhiB family transcriptional regulator, redox-sensing transcriptional regulator
MYPQKPMFDALQNDWAASPTQEPTLSAIAQVAAGGRMTERALVEALMVPPDASEIQTLLDIFRRPSWHAQAACRGTGTATFFVERGQSSEKAKAVCAVCPVRGPCLEVALSDPGTLGLWGGVSERGRRLMRRGAA